jgi:transaldolase
MSISTGVHEDTTLTHTVRDLALEGYEGPGHPHFENREKYQWLKDLGSRLWLDTGDLQAAEKVWSPEVDSLTTNNTLVNQVVQTGAMDGIIAYATRRIRDARPDISDRDLVIELAFLVNAKIALGLVHSLGAHVSVELHPDLGFDVDKTLIFARRYYHINPSHFYVKVPLTPDGFISARLLSTEGIPINYTLGFSARQNYLAARFSHPRFVNVFLGRLNSVVEENGLGDPDNIGEKTTLASYEAVRELRRSEIGIFTDQIAASIRDGRQISVLAGVDVLTMPPKAAQDYLDMDIPRHEVRRRSAQELHVTLNPEKPVETLEVQRLWEIDEPFIAFVADAVSQADQMIGGRDLIALAAKHDVNLFHNWSAEDRQRIRDKGKIPDVSQWPGAPLDDLMSISALETFAKDQDALDSRIEEIMRKA